MIRLFIAIVASIICVIINIVVLNKDNKLCLTWVYEGVIIFLVNILSIIVAFDGKRGSFGILIIVYLIKNVLLKNVNNKVIFFCLNMITSIILILCGIMSLLQPAVTAV